MQAFSHFWAFSRPIFNKNNSIHEQQQQKQAPSNFFFPFLVIIGHFLAKKSTFLPKFQNSLDLQNTIRKQGKWSIYSRPLSLSRKLWVLDQKWIEIKLFRIQFATFLFSIPYLPRVTVSEKNQGEKKSTLFDNMIGLSLACCSSSFPLFHMGVNT